MSYYRDHEFEVQSILGCLESYCPKGAEEAKVFQTYLERIREQVSNLTNLYEAEQQYSIYSN